MTTGFGSSHRHITTATTAPAISATTKPGTSDGRMPENVSVSARANVTAGLAKSVGVNQNAPLIWAATTPATDDGRNREQVQTAPTNPNVETNSPSHCEAPCLACVDSENTGASNIAFATPTPMTAPISWTGT